MEDAFHNQFYRTEPEVTMEDPSGLSQILGESESYINWFKAARNKCKIPLPEDEFIRLAQNGL